MKPQSKIPLAPLALALLCIIALAAWKISRGGGAAGARKIACYQDSMHPWIKSDRPGKCTICAMDLTPIYEGEAGFGVSGQVVVLSTNSITVINVRTEEVRRQPLARVLRVAGTLEASEGRRAVLASPAAARIDSLAVEYTGVEVEKGQPLVTLFSPELGQKLRYLRAASGPNSSQALAKSDAFSATLAAPISGTVLERPVVAGQYVTEGEKLLTIVDASVLWFRFDVYERQLAWFQPGLQLAVEVPALPGRIFPAAVSFIEPSLNEATRSVKVRADLANPAVMVNGQPVRQLRFGMYAEASVRMEIPEVLAVPRSAVLFPGGAAYACVEQGNGAYERRRIKLGRQSDDAWEVLEGLDEGDRVVTSGNVLIDAQAQFQRGDKPESDPAPAGLDHATPAQPAPMPAMTMTSPAAMLVPPVVMAPAAISNAVPMARTNAGPLAARPPSKTVADPTGRKATRAERVLAMNSVVEEMRAVRWAAMAEAHALKTNLPPAAGATNPPAPAPAPALAAPPPAPPAPPAPAAPAPVPAAASLAMNPQGRAQPPIAEPSPEARRQALATFFAAANALSQALAADSLEQFQTCLAGLTNAVPPLQKALGTGNPWAGAVQKIAAVAWAPAPDLAGARRQFLPFSTAAVELVKQVRKQDPQFAALKVFHCPMAPKPGLWMQSQGPLRNPFYGAEMLECGREVAP